MHNSIEQLANRFNELVTNNLGFKPLSYFFGAEFSIKPVGCPSITADTPVLRVFTSPKAFLFISQTCKLIVCEKGKTEFEIYVVFNIDLSDTALETLIANFAKSFGEVSPDTFRKMLTSQYCTEAPEAAAAKVPIPSAVNIIA